VDHARSWLGPAHNSYFTKVELKHVNVPSGCTERETVPAS